MIILIAQEYFRGFIILQIDDVVAGRMKCKIVTWEESRFMREEDSAVLDSDRGIESWFWRVHGGCRR